MAGLIVKIEGIDGLDGAWELGEKPFTNGEWHLLKRHFGITAGGYKAAAQEGDNDLLVGLAFIALRRNGKPLSDPDLLWEAEGGGITVIDPDAKEEAPAGPPAQQPSQSETDSDVDSIGTKQTSGEGSGGTGESLEPTPSLTGDRGSEEPSI